MDKTYFNEDITMYAFGYALGRETAAPHTCVEYLEKVWHKLCREQQNQIKSNINDALMNGTAGEDCYKEEWLKVLEWSTVV